jgi:putative transposase
VIALAVRWDARFRLSDADVAEWLAERGFTVDRSASSRWVPRFRPLFGDAARRHRARAGTTWRVDETACDFRGKHASIDRIYRAIDEDGQGADASFSERGRAAAAQAIFERAMAETAVTPTRITTDKAKGDPPALRAVLPGVEHRRSEHLNNGLERDHSHLKQRRYPMRGLLRGRAADTLARGYVLVRNLRGGFSSPTAQVPPTLRLALAWAHLTQAIGGRLGPPHGARDPRRRRAHARSPRSGKRTPPSPPSSRPAAPTIPPAARPASCRCHALP